jgi:putative hydrolase of the HAD superfamily
LARAILFDLGNTLVEYYTRDEFPAILSEATARIKAELRASGHRLPPPDLIFERIRTEDHEAQDYRVRPLEGRLSRIFEVYDEGVLKRLCDSFLEPIFACGRVYPDSIPTLKALRAKAFTLAIVSNTPWGSPAEPWRREIDRLGLGVLVDGSFFCRDVGWRKPAGPIFEHAASKLGVKPEECVFVDDNPAWDVEGSRASGMKAVLLDRQGGAEGALRSLIELLSIIIS